MKKVTVRARKEDFPDLSRIKSLFKDAVCFLEESNGAVQMVFYVPDEELNKLVDTLQESMDLRYKQVLLEVSSPDFVVSSFLKKAEKKFKTEEETPVEKLIDETKRYIKLDYGKIILTSIAGIIALTGLFMNNVTVIIGAMLLSPLLGPIYAFAVNTAVGKIEYAFRSLANLLVLVLIAILFSCLITLVISAFVNLALTPEILTRMDSSYINIFTAILLGFASMFAFSKGIPESTAGVAIAAALLPPAVVVGIMLVKNFQEILSPLTLMFENIVGLMVGGLVATLVLNIGPRRYYEKVVAKKFITRTLWFLISLVGILFLLSIFRR